jgi:hypothetical protein
MLQQGISTDSDQNEPAANPAKKAEIPQKPAEVLDGLTCLYRHFSSDGRLLYVGVSLDAVRRLVRHREKSHWFNQIATVTIERYPSRAAALQAERLAIEDEKPIYNVHRALEPPEEEELRAALNKIGERLERAASNFQGRAE